MKIALTHNLQQSAAEDQAEFDAPETITALRDALVRLGHEVEVVEVSGAVSVLVARLEHFSPELVFNIAAGSRGRTREAFYPALLEQMGLPYTGSDAFTCAVSLDKGLTKLLVAQRGVLTPAWSFAMSEADLEEISLRYPLIVKPNHEGSSKGISSRSVVRDARALRGRVRELIALYPDGLIIEEYIDGMDVVVPFIEALSAESGGALTPASYTFDGAGEAEFVIYDFDLKHEGSNRVQVQVPAPLPEHTTRKLQSVARQAIDALGVRDFGRVDFRVTPDGDIYFLEMNALPSLDPHAALYRSAALSGCETMDEVLDAIVRGAMARHQIAAPPLPGRVAWPKLRVGLVFNLKRQKMSLGGDDHEAEFDSPTTVAAIQQAIESFGHEVVLIEATAGFLTKITQEQIDVVFNIAEGVAGRSREAVVPAVLDLLGIEYTGSDATTLALSLDKALAKRVVRQSGVPTAEFFVMLNAREPLPESLSYPVVVKPNAEGSSKGISQACVARNEDELRALARDLIERYHQGALVEAFLPGREFTVGLLGQNDEPRVLPAMEIVFLDQSIAHPVYTFAHKIEADTNIRYESPAKLEPELAEEIAHVARAAYRALGCRDVSRVDVRLDANGRACFIECNPLPGLTPNWSDLCMIAKSAGMDYRTLIGEILAPAVLRWMALHEGAPQAAEAEHV